MTFWDSKKTFFLILIFSFVFCFSCKKKTGAENAEPVLEEAVNAEVTMESVESEAPGESEDVVESDSAEELPAEENLLDLEAEETEGELSFEEMLSFEDEEKRIAESLEELEESVPEVNEDEYLEKQASDLFGKESFLLFSEIDDEVVQPGFEDGMRTVTYSISNNVRKKFFDDDYRLVKIEKWNISSFDNALLAETEYFDYKGKSFVPFLKTIKQDSGMEKIYYAKKNVVEKTEKYKIVDDKPYITSLSLFTYDETGRELEIKTRDFSYNDEKDTKRRGVFEKELKYKYNKPSADGTDIPRDVYYYENDVLKSYEKYTSVPGTYTMGYYFDKNYSVVTVYQNYEKKREIIYFDGKPVRIQSPELKKEREEID